ncbi:hypothetical protein F2Q70_00011686 [Brassica cretica]|uniref:Uncharacterized protein n=2 Tax=Brassica cretica TaxID=69181 RepID=A0A8S9JH20_BRACR|nr:hypothetical protein F2Q68_00004739 [Brassica cretica]KAF2610368.1 hypothetical protein F2Q70_00011686 [Brassica cretica]KAF3543277.1 hypothetical protein DY000_02007101 [Brassica cretica]
MQQTMQAREQAAQQAAEQVAHRQERAFALIENMASSSANKNPETDRSMKVNSVDTTKIDELSAQMDQLIIINQNQIKNYHRNPNVRNNPQLFNYNNGAENPADKGQNIEKPADSPVVTTVPQDEMKSLAMMMQQLLLSQQIQGKALNQLLLVGLEKVSIDTNYGLSIDTPFNPSMMQLLSC